MTDLAKRLRDMHALAANACDPYYNQALLQAVDMIERLTERCEAYKGQVEFGAVEIGRLLAEVRTLRNIGVAQDKEIERLRSALTQHWQPIETAPKDGTTIFAANWKMAQRGLAHMNSQGKWEMVNGLTNYPMGIGFYPTHWMPEPPVPEPPKP